MTRVATERPTGAPQQTEPDSAPMSDSDAARNFVALVLHQVLLRVGWIFKTESIVMPMFLSLIGGSSTLLGWMPVFNRIGLSIPPLLYARSLKLAPLKNRRVMSSSMAMAAPFLVLSGVWFSGVWRNGDRVSPWMPYFFLAVYAAFFCVTGVNQLGMHTLQGKLVRFDLRGRLFTAGVLVGAPIAVLLAWLLLPGWLNQPDGGFGWVFGFTAIAFLAAGACLAFTRESPDAYEEPPEAALQKFRAAWRVLVHDARARPIAILAMLISVNLMLFPHYQSLYPRAPGTTAPVRLDQMMLWVCVQNVGTACFSLIAGPLADRVGNRAALRLAVAGLAAG
ncbi:MAG: hypothetical protein KDA37_00680, partial [Planctomycetales bacterium]|nr:hypothetical protein [Planctomycetales bacterium]